MSTLDASRSCCVRSINETANISHEHGLRYSQLNERMHDPSSSISTSLIAGTATTSLFEADTRTGRLFSSVARTGCGRMTMARGFPMAVMVTTRKSFVTLTTCLQRFHRSECGCRVQEIMSDGNSNGESHPATTVHRLTYCNRSKIMCVPNHVNRTSCPVITHEILSTDHAFRLDSRFCTACAINLTSCSLSIMFGPSG